MTPRDADGRRGDDEHARVDIGGDAFVPDARAVACLDAASARRARVVPLWFEPAGSDEGCARLTLASAGPADLPRRDRVRRALPGGLDVLWKTASESGVARALDRCYGVDLTLDAVVAACDASSDALDPGGVTAAANDSLSPSPIARLVDALLADAVARGASDIHLSPEEHAVTVRHRVDGVLGETRRLERRHLDALTVRIKVLAGADIAETRRPQDGRFSRRMGGRHVDFRLSCFPLRTGENLVLRVLERHATVCRLDDLAPPADTRRTLRDLVNRPEGLVVVSGPTGAGKTTTLYALLGERDVATLNVMTLEDPIEHPVEGVRQASIDASRGLDYAAGVRALLRQDPDVLLIGEVRDADSCAMALRAALTGHLVLTTVHASDAIGVVGRLRELGAEPGVLADVLAGVVAQRLVRTRCALCEGTGRDRSETHAGDACARCDGCGLRGRRAVLETFVPDASLAALVRAGADAATLAGQAASHGHRSLVDRARDLAAAGVTTVGELERVFGVTPDAPAATAGAAV